MTFECMRDIELQAVGWDSQEFLVKGIKYCRPRTQNKAKFQHSFDRKNKTRTHLWRSLIWFGIVPPFQISFESVALLFLILKGITLTSKEAWNGGITPSQTRILIRYRWVNIIRFKEYMLKYRFISRSGACDNLFPI